MNEQKEQEEEQEEKIRRKPGRPKTTGKAPARSIRVWGEEWDRWTRAAADRGISVSALIHQRMRRI